MKTDALGLLGACVVSAGVDRLSDFWGAFCWGLTAALAFALFLYWTDDLVP